MNSNAPLKILLAGIFIVLIPILSFSQESNFGNWIIYFGNKKFKNGWNLHHEAQYRNYDAIGDLEQLLLRTGVGKNLTEGNNNLLMGYAYILSENYLDGEEDKMRTEEHRIFQQFITTQREWRVKFLHRYRFEQRWIEGDFRLRFRYFLSINVPISQPDMVDNTWYFSAYNEIFINGDGNLFDRNRVYLGAGYRLNPMFRFEIGYMAQLLQGTSRDQLNLITFCNF